MKLLSGHEAIPVDGEELEKRKKDWEDLQPFIRLNPGGWFLPLRYTELADKLFTFKQRKSDVMVMSFPKCGTTWTQEILWTMMNNPGLDNPEGKQSISIRSPSVYGDILLPKPKPDDLQLKIPIVADMIKKYGIKDPTDGLCIQITDVFPDIRIIKTHLPLSLSPPSTLDTCKVVYVARNPKDVLLSFHHQCKILKAYGYVGNFEDFVQYFVDDEMVYGPYWLHVKEAWEKRDHPNLHFLFYEDLKANPLEELHKLNTFLNKDLTDTQLEAIVEHTAFKEMKQREGDTAAKAGNVEIFNKDNLKKDGGFFRKGESGDWKNKLSPEIVAKVDQYIEKKFSTFGVTFK